MKYICNFLKSILGCNIDIKTYTLDEIKTHNKENDCWIIVNKKVYDVTKFINNHPGGKQCLLKKAGTDCTRDLSFHSNDAKKLMLDMKIGNVAL